MNPGVSPWKERRRAGLSLFLALLIFSASIAFGGQARAGCADGGLPFPSAQSDGIGGTGLVPHDPDEGGIGGTGRTGDEQGDDGIGGTGIRAEGDAAIVGTVTGFGSICLGDLEIHYADDTPVVSEGRVLDASALAVGQVVEVVAEGAGDEVTARVIGIDYVVRGPVSDVDPIENRIVVMGQTIQLGASTWTATDSELRQATAEDFRAGDFVQVSGLRRDDNVIMASHVARTGAGEAVVSLSGPVTEARATVVRVARTAVELPAGEAASFSAGDSVVVSGTWDGTTIRAGHVALRPSIPFDARVKRLDVEGYVREPAAGHGLLVGQQRVRLREQSSDLKPGQRIRVEAVVSPDRQLIDGRIVPLRDLPPASSVPRPPLRGGPPAPARRAGQRDEAGRGSAAGSVEPPGRRREMDRPGLSPHRSGVAESRPPRVLPELSVRPERPDRVDLPRPPARPEPPERPQRPELPQRPDPLQRPEFPERPQRFDR